MKITVPTKDGATMSITGQVFWAVLLDGNAYAFLKRRSHGNEFYGRRMDVTEITTGVRVMVGIREDELVVNLVEGISLDKLKEKVGQLKKYNPVPKLPKDLKHLERGQVLLGATPVEDL
jgi:hypothetical protein